MKLDAASRLLPARAAECRYGSSERLDHSHPSSIYADVRPRAICLLRAPPALKPNQIYRFCCALDEDGIEHLPDATFEAALHMMAIRRNDPERV